MPSRFANGVRCGVLFTRWNVFKRCAVELLYWIAFSTSFVGFFSELVEDSFRLCFFLLHCCCRRCCAYLNWTESGMVWSAKGRGILWNRHCDENYTDRAAPPRLEVYPFYYIFILWRAYYLPYNIVFLVSLSVAFISFRLISSRVPLDAMFLRLNTFYVIVLISLVKITAHPGSPRSISRLPFCLQSRVVKLILMIVLCSTVACLVSVMVIFSSLGLVFLCAVGFGNKKHMQGFEMIIGGVLL